MLRTERRQRLGTEAEFNHAADLAFGPDGSLYIAETYNQRIGRVAASPACDPNEN